METNKVLEINAGWARLLKMLNSLKEEEERMKKITWTRQASTKQMSRMAANLREKFKTSTQISISSWAYHYDDKDGDCEEEYRLWISEHLKNSYYPTWQALQQRYFELMEE